VPARNPAGNPESREIAVAAARAAATKQGADIVILEVGPVLVIADFFVIVTGTSDRQVRTIVEEVEKSLKERGVRPLRREGETAGRWILLDYVDVVVHVFADEEREFYSLERLWRDAARVQWEEADAASGE